MRAPDRGDDAGIGFEDEFDAARLEIRKHARVKDLVPDPLFLPDREAPATCQVLRREARDRERPQLCDLRSVR
jgi:hypothetical protein